MQATLTRTRLVGGVWEGVLLTPGAKPPVLCVRHQDELVGALETSRFQGTPEQADHQWHVRFAIPADRLADGAQVFVFENSETGDVLAHETIFVGDVVEDDIRGEIALLRAELDLLKRAFRQHCSES